MRTGSCKWRLYYNLYFWGCYQAPPNLINICAAIWEPDPSSMGFKTVLTIAFIGTRIRLSSILNKPCSFSFLKEMNFKKHVQLHLQRLSFWILHGKKHYGFLRKQNLLSFGKRFWKVHIQTWNELMLKFSFFYFISIHFFPTTRHDVGAHVQVLPINRHRNPQEDMSHSPKCNSLANVF